MRLVQRAVIFGALGKNSRTDADRLIIDCLQQVLITEAFNISWYMHFLPPPPDAR